MKKVAQFIAVSLGAAGALLTLRTFRRYHHEMEAARQRVRAGSEILKTDRGVIEYAVRGEGVPTLALHGAGGGYDQGLLLGRMSPAGLKLISVSRFGYLRSPIPENASVQAQAALYAALLEHLEIESVIVLGGSAGGPSSLQFAHDYPERSSALILVSAISMPIGPDRDTFQNKAIHTIQKSDFLYWLLTKSLQSQFLALVGVPPAVYRALTLEQKSVVQETLDVMHPMSPRRAGSIHEFEITPLDPVSMNEIAVPTLILHSRDDQLVNYQHAEFAHRHIPQSKLVAFATGGHGLLGRVDEVRDHVGRFLETLQAC